MFYRKTKILIYILLFLFALNFTVPISSLGIDDDSIYVWSNNSSSLSTSTSPTEENNQTTVEDNSRKLFGNHFRWCYINRARIWNYFI